MPILMRNSALGNSRKQASAALVLRQGTLTGRIESQPWCPQGIPHRTQDADHSGTTVHGEDVPCPTHPSRSWMPQSIATARGTTSSAQSMERDRRPALPKGARTTSHRVWSRSRAGPGLALSAQTTCWPRVRPGVLGPRRYVGPDSRLGIMGRPMALSEQSAQRRVVGLGTRRRAVEISQH